MDRRKDGRMDRRTNGEKDRQTDLILLDRSDQRWGSNKSLTKKEYGSAMHFLPVLIKFKSICDE